MLLQAIDLDPSDVLVLVFAWKLGAKRMGYFSQEEWLEGSSWFSICSSHSDICDRLKAIFAGTTGNATALRTLHSFTHKFCREDERVRNIDVRAHSALLPAIAHVLPHGALRVSGDRPSVQCTACVISSAAPGVLCRWAARSSC